jgi:hypothetical protein
MARFLAPHPTPPFGPHAGDLTAVLRSETRDTFGRLPLRERRQERVPGLVPLRPEDVDRVEPVPVRARLDERRTVLRRERPDPGVERARPRTYRGEIDPVRG